MSKLHAFESLDIHIIGENWGPKGERFIHRARGVRLFAPMTVTTEQLDELATAFDSVVDAWLQRLRADKEKG